MSMTPSTPLPVGRAPRQPLLPALAGRALKRIVAHASPRQRLSILIYHRVLAQPDPLFPDEVDAATFDRHLGRLRQCFNIIPLGQAVRALREGSLPPGAACITFDDGYADNAEVALPILQRHGVSATVFVATGFLDGGRMWNDTVIETIRQAPAAIDLSSLGYGRYALDSMAQRRAAIYSLLGALKYLPVAQRLAEVEAIRAQLAASPRDDLMMSRQQVRALHQAGIEIGGHTVTHPILARLDADSARQEIAGGKHELEALTGAPVRLFAYPNGKPGQDYQAEHVAMVRQLGFEAAVSTSWGASGIASDPFQLARFTPWDRGALRFQLRMLANLRRNGDVA